MHIVIDFDNTLFNTDAMRAALLEALEQFGVTKEQYQSTEKELISHQGTYNLEGHLDLMLSGSKREQAGTLADQVLDQADEYLYPDAQHFLQQYNEEQLTILTFGPPEWQQRKIKNAGLDNAVTEVITTLGEKKDIIADMTETEVIVIEDKASEIDAMKQARPEYTYIWIRREGTSYYDQPCRFADYEVHDLAFDVRELMNSK